MVERADGLGRAAGAAFWRFSLALYARPGVADALLGLQDCQGRNVNLMLYALWLGAVRGQRLDAAALGAAVAAIAPVDEAVVKPLRAVRRQLKPDEDPMLQALRRRIAALEIVAERGVQYRLAASLAAPLNRSPAVDRLAAAAANLALYLGDEAASAEVEILRAAVAALTRRTASGQR